MTDTTTLIQRLRLMSPDLIGGEAADALEQQAAQINRMQIELNALAADIALRDTEIEALLADAERYRWLRRTTNAVTSKGDRIDVRNNPDLWDSAIDAALRQEQPT